MLSQYLTAIQLDGGVPPQESGLTCSTWYGKHHTEMAFWHLAHFVLWGRGPPLARALDWFVAGLPAARALARERGLTGARWAKMVGPDLRESPGGNPLIAWNQPHPIFLAELLYRGRHDRKATMRRTLDAVLASWDWEAKIWGWDGAGESAPGFPKDGSWVVRWEGLEPLP